MCVVDALKLSMLNRKIRRWMVVWKFFYTFIHHEENMIIFVCLFPIIDNYFTTYRLGIFRFCLHWCFFKNSDQDGEVFDFSSISGNAWCELWHSSHNDILTLLSQCPSSGYFKNHWDMELLLKCHWGSQNVHFFLLGTNHFIKHSGLFLLGILFYN